MTNKQFLEDLLVKLVKAGIATMRDEDCDEFFSNFDPAAPEVAVGYRLGITDKLKGESTFVLEALDPPPN
jgi:hypothetical protein